MIKKTLNNEKGILTIDFIFGAMVIFGLSSVIFSFGMTFSVVEVVQYVSFASARNYSLAHLDETRQKERAQQKYQELVTSPIFAPLVEMGWFELAPIVISDFNSEYDPDTSYESDNFIGARIPFNAPILYKKIPFVGDTADDRDAFQTNIQSFLAREPTFVECRNFMSERANSLRSLGYGQLQPGEVVITMDNGC